MGGCTYTTGAGGRSCEQAGKFQGDIFFLEVGSRDLQTAHLALTVTNSDEQLQQAVVLTCFDRRFLNFNEDNGGSGNNHPTRQGAAPCAFAHASPVMAVTCGGKSDRGWARSTQRTLPFHWFSLDQKK